MVFLKLKHLAEIIMLGGDDIDEILIDWMADDFKKSTGVDLRKDKTSYQRLKEAAEKAKIELSSKLKQLLICLLLQQIIRT
jgi:molecular chaperone DnaK (HSP70)